MIETCFSIDDQRWPITPVLVWIASRNFKFVKALKNLPPNLADPAMWNMRKKCNPPLTISLHDACDLLRQEIEFENFVETNWSGFKQKGSPLAGFNEHELWMMNVMVAKADLLRLWPPFLDWEAVNARPWLPSADLSVDCLKVLLFGEYVSLSDVIDLLAFGKSRTPLGLSDSEIMTARLRVGLAIDLARRQGRLQLLGRPAKRNPGDAQSVRSLGTLDKIESHLKTEAVLLPVPHGARDWLGPLLYVEEFAAIGAASESVSFIDVVVERESLRRWVADLSGETNVKWRGRPPEFPWIEIKVEAMRLMNRHGDFTADNKKWNAQARLEDALMTFCSNKFDRQPVNSTLRVKIRPWLAEWRSGKRTVGN